MLEMLCVALAVYFEARGESLEGQRAVASVVWNRRNDERWPNHTCEVVAQKGQFESFPLIKAEFPLLLGSEYLDLPPNESMKIALAHASYTAETPTTSALFFATPNLLKYKELEVIGNHVFYTTHD